MTLTNYHINIVTQISQDLSENTNTPATIARQPYYKRQNDSQATTLTTHFTHARNSLNDCDLTNEVLYQKRGKTTLNIGKPKTLSTEIN